jgi:hypothetical protein
MLFFPAFSPVFLLLYVAAVYVVATVAAIQEGYLINRKVMNSRHDATKYIPSAKRIMGTIYEEGDLDPILSMS